MHPGNSRQRRGRAEESDDSDQPAVGADLAKIDRRVAAGSVRAHQAPEEADHVVMHVDTAHEFEPRPGPRWPAPRRSASPVRHARPARRWDRDRRHCRSSIARAGRVWPYRPARSRPPYIVSRSSRLRCLSIDAPVRIPHVRVAHRASRFNSCKELSGSSLTSEVIALLTRWSRLPAWTRQTRTRKLSRPGISAAC